MIRELPFSLHKAFINGFRIRFSHGIKQLTVAAYFSPCLSLIDLRKSIGDLLRILMEKYEAVVKKSQLNDQVGLAFRNRKKNEAKLKHWKELIVASFVKLYGTWNIIYWKWKMKTAAATLIIRWQLWDRC